MFFIIFISKKLALTASFLYYCVEVNVMKKISLFTFLLPVIALEVLAGIIIKFAKLDSGTASSITISLVSLGFTMSMYLVQPKSTNNRWLINKEVECFENIIDSCEFYSLLIEEYESDKIDFKDLVGIHKVEFIKTLIVSKRSIKNYMKYLTATDKSGELFEKLCKLIGNVKNLKLIENVENCTCNTEKLKNDIKKIIDLSYQLINLSPYIYSHVNKKKIDHKTQEVLKGCD